MPIATTDTSVSVDHQTVGRFTHVMADEATQGIDPDGSERITEEAHVISLW